MEDDKRSLIDDELDLNRVEITAEEATRLRHYASRGSWKMPVSQYERDLYMAQGIEAPE